MNFNKNYTNAHKITFRVLFGEAFRLFFSYYRRSKPKNTSENRAFQFPIRKLLILFYFSVEKFPRIHGLLKRMKHFRFRIKELGRVTVLPCYHGDSRLGYLITFSSMVVCSGHTGGSLGGLKQHKSLS